MTTTDLTALLARITELEAERDQARRLVTEYMSGERAQKAAAQAAESRLALADRLAEAARPAVGYTINGIILLAHSETFRALSAALAAYDTSLLKAKLSLSAQDTSDAELGPGMPDENSLGPLV